MKYVLLTDIHFGARNNSMTWWKSQKSFICDQLIPHIESMKEDVNIIHLGDVFDSRSSISTFIMVEVQNIFKQLSSIKNVKNIYVIAGNHDFYSPVSDEWASIDIVLRDIPKVHLIVKEPAKNSDELYFFPWYQIEKHNISKFKQGTTIFTHADIVTGKPRLSAKIFSGHMHVPCIEGNRRNLGSCFALDFNDHDQERYFYVWDSGTDELQLIPNEKSIKFYRVYNEDVLDFETDNSDDYVELYIKNSLATKPEYIDAIKRLFSKYKNIWNIPQPDSTTNDVEVGPIDIDSIIVSGLPEQCKEKFEYIKNKNECI